MSLMSPLLLQLIYLWMFLSGAHAEGRGGGIVSEEQSQDRDAAPAEEDGAYRSPVYSPVVRLTDATFAGNVLASPRSYVDTWVVFFCVDWAKECRSARAAFEERAATWHRALNDGSVLGSAVRFAHVECATHKVLCNTQDVDEYPFVVEYQEGVARRSVGGSAKKAMGKLETWLEELDSRLRLMSEMPLLGQERTSSLVGELLEAVGFLSGGELTMVAASLLGVLGYVLRLALEEPKGCFAASGAAATAAALALRRQQQLTLADRLASDLWGDGVPGGRQTASAGVDGSLVL